MKNNSLCTSVIFAGLVTSSQALGAVHLITINTTSFHGTNAELALDFIDGGPPLNNIVLSNFKTDGVLQDFSQVGSVSGALTSSLSFSDADFFSEHSQQTSLGTSISFIINDSGNAPVGSSFPDSFSVFLFDVSGAPLVTTNDPTGSNALFRSDIGLVDGLSVYSGANFSVSVSTIPEPSSFMLAAAGLTLLGFVWAGKRIE
jgi:hypothetical protein